MPKRKLIALLFVALAAVGGGHKANAQENISAYCSDPDSVPFDLATDWNWFETSYCADLEELSPKKRAGTGMFFTYDRTYLYVTRPQNEESYTEGDFGWGNRMDFGFMGDNDKGWSATYWSVTGPNAYEIDFQSRANVLNSDDPALGGDGGGIVDPIGQLLPVRDRNNSNFNERIYLVQDSLNVMEMKGIEFNRTWRLDSYRKGGVLEPMIGLRYLRFQDVTRDDEYTVGPGTRVDSGGNLVTQLRENFSSQVDWGNNDMIGGQLGFRYFRYRGRWRHSLDMRAFAFQNFQSHRFNLESTDTFYGANLPGTVDDAVLFEDTNVTTTYRHGTEFVFGFDLRAEAGYQVFRDVNLRVGLQVMDFAQGILRGAVRGGTPSQINGSSAISDQNVWLAGLTFGFDIKR